MTDSSTSIPPPIQSFVQQHIPSLHQLEILLWVATPPLRTWRADTIALQLYLPLDLVEVCLTDLVHRGVLQTTELVAPSGYTVDPVHSAVVAQLATYYRQHRITLTTFIFNQPSAVVQSFAAAFKVRKES